MKSNDKTVNQIAEYALTIKGVSGFKRYGCYGIGERISNECVEIIQSVTIVRIISLLMGVSLRNRKFKLKKNFSHEFLRRLRGLTMLK